MTAAHLAIVTGAALVLLTAMSVVMSRANQRAREMIERRHAQWIADGSIPDEKPHFDYLGSGG